MLKVYYQNVNRIRSKVQDVYKGILAEDYDIICLTETNFNSGVHSGEVVDGRYNVFRRDRESTRSHKDDGGGVLIAAKD